MLTSSCEFVTYGTLQFPKTNSCTSGYKDAMEIEVSNVISSVEKLVKTNFLLYGKYLAILDRVLIGFIYFFHAITFP